jgi:hypothetical protein
MQLLSKVALAMLLASCNGPAPIHEPPSDRRVEQAPRWGYHTPALNEAQLDVEIVTHPSGMQGVLHIDGRSTHQPWDAEHPPRIDATGDGRYLLYGPTTTQADWELFVWEPELARLTKLGVSARVEVPTLGAVFVRSIGGETVDAIFELSRSEPKLEPIWEGGPAWVVGAHDGGLLLLEMLPGSAKLTTIRYGARIEQHTADFDGWRVLPHPTYGGFDRGRLLLARMLIEHSHGAFQQPPTDPGMWELAILDVDSGDLRVLGEIPGSWTATAISDAAPPSARFVDELDESVLEVRGSCVTQIRRADLELATRCPGP